MSIVEYLVDQAGRTAYLAGITSILGFLALFVFFAGVGVFGPINDAISVFQMLFLVPTLIAFHLALGGRTAPWTAALTAVGVLSLLGVAALQFLLVTGRLSFEQTLRPILLLGFPLAAWWIATGALALSQPELPTGLAWSAIASGIGFAVIAVGYLAAGPMHPVTAIGFLVGAVAVPVWALWLGRLITSGRITVGI